MSMMSTSLDPRSVLLSRLPQHARQSSQDIAHANAACAGSFLDFAVALFQSFGRCAEHAICDPFGCVAVLLHLVYAVCEKVDARLERLTEFVEMRLQSRGSRKRKGQGWLLFRGRRRKL